jgi:hypothetical protein
MLQWDKAMNLYDSERPTLTNGRPALLKALVAVPIIYIMPKEENGWVELSLMLPRNDANGGFGYHHLDMALEELPIFFTKYRLDPELTIELYFNWKPEHRSTRSRVPEPKPTPKPYVDPDSGFSMSMDDLI